MCRSSIFNFESLEGFKPRVPLGLLAAAAIVLGVELFVRVVPDTWLIPSYSRLGFRGFMERRVLPHYDAPQIAIFGTSRAADAIVPARIDKALDLPPNSTVNLSIFGSRTSDWLNLYERNREKLSKCKLVLVVVDEWMFSSGVDNDEEFCLDASLADRWNYIQPVKTPPIDETPAQREKREAAKLDFMRLKRNRMLADWAFNMRLKLQYAPLAIAKSMHLGKKREPVYDDFHMVRSTSAESGKEAENSKNYDERIRNFYKYFDTHPVYVRHVEDIARLIKEDGGRLILVHLPNRQTYQQEVESLIVKKEGEADFHVKLAYDQHVRVTRELAERIGAPFYYYKFPDELKLADDDYVDYCHMAMSGAETCTDEIVKWLRKEMAQK